MEPFGKNDTPAQYSFIKLVQKFVYLENLQLKYVRSSCSSCKYAQYENYHLLLSHYPFLIRCVVDRKLCNMIDVISQCKLKYFGCMLVKSKTFSTVANWCLQHLSITSYGSRITDVFMDSVSAHGGLESVFFQCSL